MTPHTAKILYLPVIRIERDEMGAWLVISWNGHGWAFGSRTEAILEARWLNANARGQRL
jgi:hypothetical protein